MYLRFVKCIVVKSIGCVAFETESKKTTDQFMCFLFLMIDVSHKL